MRYFIDTEFIESGPHKPIDLISIGIVCEDGRELYRVSSEWREENCSDWVKANVLPHLGQHPRCSLPVIADDVLTFCDNTLHGKPEFWGYYSDYDWVVFCQMFGRMIDLPKDWPMFCRDIKQLAVERGNPQLPKQSDIEHNALSDARWNLEAWKFLNSASPSVEREALRAIRESAKKLLVIFKSGHNPSFEMLERLETLIVGSELAERALRGEE